MHVNSLLAYYAGRKEFSKREMMILGWLLMNPGAWTDRQIKTGLEQADMNGVRPRINELIERQALEVVGDTVCPVTGKTVRMVRIGEGFLNRTINAKRSPMNEQLVLAGGERVGRNERWKIPARVGEQGALFS